MARLFRLTETDYGKLGFFISSLCFWNRKFLISYKKYDPYKNNNMNRYNINYKQILNIT